MASPAYADSTTGGTFVTTLPSGADVWFDGTYVGRSPLFVDGLAEGRHALSIVKSGWSSQDASVAIVRGAVVVSGVRLLPGKRAGGAAGPGVGTLVLREIPAGAELSLDGSAIAVPSLKAIAMPAGTHELVVRTARGRSTRSIAIYPELATYVILRESSVRRERSAVIAPAEDYLPTNAFVVEGRRIVVRYGGHVAIARFGETMVRVDGAATEFDSAPEEIGGKVYLPLELLEKLSGDVSKPR
ncbi:MAG: hypothetical protein NVS2B3_08620 [Vulcanimicrobiaceae bacterium]